MYKRTFKLTAISSCAIALKFLFKIILRRKCCENDRNGCLKNY